MNWKEIKNEADLESIKTESANTPQVIFKHSTKCSISSMAKSRLERAAAPEGITFNYLDLIAYRIISNKIADDFNVDHASPQVLVIKNGECIYDESHNAISMDEIAEQVA